jgi:ribosomal protein S27AE
VPGATLAKVLVEHPEPRIACNKCGCVSEAATEAEAEGYGWVVDYGSDPHAHFCPACGGLGQAPGVTQQ